MRTLLRVTLTSLSLVACRTEVPARDDAPIVVQAETPGAEARVQAAATVHMPSHFADVLEAHEAAIRGSLPDTKAAAEALLQVQPSLTLEDWEPFRAAMQAAAREVVAAETATQSAEAVARLAATCGRCHAELGVKLDIQRLAPPEGDDPPTRMRRHKWAVDRLWEGLVRPSDDAWSDGAAHFADLPPCEAPGLSAERRAAIEAARATSRQQQAVAGAAGSIEARISAYAALLPTCAACHEAGCAG